MALEEVDVILLLSELESFSNNVLEAFSSRTPLVISDRDWARASCGNGALYVDPHDPDDVARALAQAVNDEVSKRLADNGEAMLTAHYKHAEARLEDVLEFIDVVVRDNECQ